MIIFLLSIFLILFLTGRAPLRNLICLIGIFGFASLLLIYYDVEFLGWMLIMIYIGAIGVLFLFLIMTTDFRNIENTPSVSSYDYLLYVIISLLLLVRLPDLIADTSFLQDELLTLMPGDNFWGLQKWYHLETNTLLFVGLLMFNKYYVFVHLAAWILLIALVAAVGLSSDRWNDVKKLIIPSFLLEYHNEIDSPRSLYMMIPEHGEYTASHKWSANGYYSFDTYAAMLDALKNSSWKDNYGYSRLFFPMRYKKFLAANNPTPFPRVHTDIISVVQASHVPEVGTAMRGGIVKRVSMLRQLFIPEDEQLFRVVIDWEKPIVKPWELHRTWLKKFIEHPHKLTNKEKKTLSDLCELRWIKPRYAYEWEEWEIPELFVLSAWGSVVLLGVALFAWIYSLLIDIIFRQGPPIFVPFFEGSRSGLIQDPQGPGGRFESWDLVPLKWRTEDHFEVFVSIPIWLFAFWFAYYTYCDPAWQYVLFVSWCFCRTPGCPDWRKVFNEWWIENNVDENVFVICSRLKGDKVEFLCQKALEAFENYVLSNEEFFLFYSKQYPILYVLILLISILYFFLTFTLYPTMLIIAAIAQITVATYLYFALKPYYIEWRIRLSIIWDIYCQGDAYYEWNKKYFERNPKEAERLATQFLYEVKKSLIWLVKPLYLEPHQRTYHCYLTYATSMYEKALKQESMYYKDDDVRWYDMDFEYPVFRYEYDLPMSSFGPGYSDHEWTLEDEYYYQSYSIICGKADEEEVWSKFHDKPFKWDEFFKRMWSKFRDQTFKWNKLFKRMWSKFMKQISS